MTRRSLFRVLLSLLLLTAQQMAFSHAVSHWTGQSGQGQAHQARAHDDEGDLSSAFAQGQSCDQCLAFAQVGAALGSNEWAFSAPEGAFCRTAAGAAQVHHRITVAAFQPRAPPQA